MTKVISGYVDVPPEDRPDFARGLPEHSRLTNAEPGCQYFSVTLTQILRDAILLKKFLTMKRPIKLTASEHAKRNGHRLHGI